MEFIKIWAQIFAFAYLDYNIKAKKKVEIIQDYS